MSKCPIYNALLKYRPDLEPVFRHIKPNRQAPSVRFMVEHGFWTQEAEEFYTSFEPSVVEGGIQTRSIPKRMALKLASMLVPLIKGDQS